MLRVARPITLCASALMATQAFGANLVLNPNFDTDVSDWTNQGLGTFTFSGSDGSPSPGSARLVAQDATTPAAAASDCILIDAEPHIDFSALVKGNAGSGLLIANAFSDTNCTNSLNDGPLFGVDTSHIGTWVALSANDQTLPSGTKSVHIIIYADVNPGGAPSDISVDTVYFGPDVVFANGFETN